jgi:hypothetical protein
MNNQGEGYLDLVDKNVGKVIGNPLVDDGYLVFDEISRGEGKDLSTYQIKGLKEVLQVNVVEPTPRRENVYIQPYVSIPLGKYIFSAPSNRLSEPSSPLNLPLDQYHVLGESSSPL